MFYTYNSRCRRAIPVTLLMATCLFSGCATMVEPKSLSRPDSVTCLTVSDGVEAKDMKGVLDIPWVTRLSPGVYISEWQDEGGSYYRAPPGGVYIGRSDWTGEQAKFAGTHYDGGLWIPHDPAKQPQVYTYSSVGNAEVTPHPRGVTCEQVAVTQDPDTQGVKAIDFVVSGIAGGAAGGTVARATTSNNSMSYGQAAGAGAVGGAIGGAIVAAMINKDIGKIVHQPLTTDDAFYDAIERLVTQEVAVRQSEE